MPSTCERFEKHYMSTSATWLDVLWSQVEKKYANALAISQNDLEDIAVLAKIQYRETLVIVL